MRFELIDRFVDVSGEHAVAMKAVSRAEEYLGDHFPTFPVLPGVFMLEAMVQAARRVLAEREGAAEGGRRVLGGVRAVKYGTFLSPGDVMRVEVRVLKAIEGGGASFKGEGRVLRPGEGGDAEGAPVCVSGRFELRGLALVGAGR